MKLPKLAALLVAGGFIFANACEPDLKPFSPPEKDFSILLPATPVRTEPPFDEHMSDTRFTASGRGVDFVVQVLRVDTNLFPAALQTDMIDRVVRESGGSALERSPIARDGMSGQGFLATVNGRRLVAHSWFLGPTAYVLVATNVDEAHYDWATTVLDSFRVAPTRLKAANDLHLCAPAGCTRWTSLGPGFSVNMPVAYLRDMAKLPMGDHGAIASSYPVMVLAFSKAIPEDEPFHVPTFSGRVVRSGPCPGKGNECMEVEADGARITDEAQGTSRVQVINNPSGVDILAVVCPPRLPRGEVDSFFASYSSERKGKPRPSQRLQVIGESAPP